MNDTIRHEAIGLLVKKSSPSVAKVIGGVAKGGRAARRMSSTAKRQLQELMFRGQSKNRALAAWEKQLDSARKSSAEFAEELERATQAGKLGKLPRARFRRAYEQIYNGPRAANSEIVDLQRLGKIKEYPEELRNAYHRHVKNIDGLRSSSDAFREAINPGFSHYDLGRDPITSGRNLPYELRSASEDLKHINWKNVAKWRARLG